MVNKLIVWLTRISLSIVAVLSLHLAIKAQSLPSLPLMSEDSFVTTMDFSQERSPSIIKFPHLMAMSMDKTKSEFEPISQPLGLKIGATIAGLGLIILELWWFLGR